MFRPGLHLLSTLFVIAGTDMIAHAVADVWDGNGASPPSNNWSFAPSWADDTTPENSDTATFNLADAYTVSFSVTNPDAIQALTISSGNVTFASTSSTGRTLRINSASGSQDVTVTGASTRFTLGASPSNDVSLLVGDDLSVQNDAVLIAQFGSDLTAADFSAAGLNGLVEMSGPGATLALTGSGANNFIGRSGRTGRLRLVNGTTGNSIAGNLGIADSASANSTGAVTLAAGSTLSLAGNLTLANRNVAGQAATLDIYGNGTSLTQSGASSITVGSAANGTADINIGVSSDGGTLTTGTGTFTINATGTVTIGNSGNNNEGALLANGDLLVNGGVLRQNRGLVELDPARTMTIQNGGLFDVRGFYHADAAFVVTGPGSAWTNTDSLSIGAFGTGSLTISASGDVSNTIGQIAATAGSDGAVTVTGAGSTWTNSSSLSVGSQGSGVLTIAAQGSVSNTDGSVGGLAGSSGTATVTGAGSTWTNSGDLNVGDQGIGRLNIQQGGVVSSGFGGVGLDPGSDGNVTVTDAGSTWNSGAGITVGNEGIGWLAVKQGAVVSSVGGAVGNNLGGEGYVTVSGAGSTWTNNDLLLIGNFIGSTGQLGIAEGGSITSAGGILGVSASHDALPAANGQVIVGGAGSTWTNTGDLYVGVAGTGYLTIKEGGGVSSLVGYVGLHAGGQGTVAVSGNGSIWNTSSLRVGGSQSTAGGNGTLMVSHGGHVEVGGSTTVWAGGTIDLSTGGKFTSSGLVTINGGSVNISGGTLQTLSSSLVIMRDAEISVTGGGSLASAAFLDVGINGGSGTLVVSGISSTASGAASGVHSWALNGQSAHVNFSSGASGSFSGGLNLAASTTASTKAVVDVLSGAELAVGNLFLAVVGGATTSATITIDGAGSGLEQTGNSTITVGHWSTGLASLVVRNNAALTTGTGPILVEDTGSIEINSGAVFDARGTITMSGGSFRFLGGTLHVDNFNGDLVNQGGTLAPGHSAGATSIIGHYEQSSLAKFEVEIGGTTAGMQYDTLGVTGTTKLAGTLAVSLVDSFAPALGDDFVILTSGGQINGSFETVLLPTLTGGLEWNVAYSSSAVTLQVVSPGVIGDYNNDGMVDAGDFVVWRKNDGTSNLLLNDPIGGTIGPAQYNQWRSHFGQTAGSGSGAAANAAVPEPATLFMLMLTVPLWCSRRRSTAPRCLAIATSGPRVRVEMENRLLSTALAKLIFILTRTMRTDL